MVRRSGFPGGDVAAEGIVLIDEISHHTLGIILRAIEIPSHYEIEEFMQSVFFGHVNIEGKIHLLPLASESIMGFPDVPVLRQSSRYRNYRKFHVESDLRFERAGSVTNSP